MANVVDWERGEGLASLGQIILIMSVTGEDYTRAGVDVTVVLIDCSREWLITHKQAITRSRMAQH